MDPSAGIGVLAAVFAGAISFLSPCVLPLVPGYLAAVTGVSPDRLDGASTRQVLLPSLAFVATFSVIFILLGVTASGLGNLLIEQRRTLEKVSAALIIAMGLLFMAAPFIDRLNREFHVGGLMRRAGRGGPFVAGAAFAIAWTPCVGPTLGAVLSAAALTESAGRGAFLLACYSAGLAIPFLATALAFRRMTTSFAVVKRHYAVVIAVGGFVLVVMGVLIWTGELFRLNIEAQRLLEDLGVNVFDDV